MEAQYRVDVIAPFSPIILRAEVPSHLISKLNQLVDVLIGEDRECATRDWSHQLAGNVHRELRITDLIQADFDILHFILSIAKQFALGCPNLMMAQSIGTGGRAANLRIHLEDAWVNEMVQGDFSPVHFHSGCQISCVGFLRVPDTYDLELASDKPNTHSVGCLQFIDSRTVAGANNMYMVKPTTGTFYMFPSWMLHCVYPFRSEGIRRSFSANLTVSQAAVD
jgi:hypothetical protein